MEPPIYHWSEDDAWLKELIRRVGDKIGEALIANNLLHTIPNKWERHHLDKLACASIMENNDVRLARYEAEDAKEQEDWNPSLLGI